MVYDHEYRLAIGVIPKPPSIDELNTLLRYTYANESLEAITMASQSELHENALVVCGSGDIAFALLEHFDSVTAIDFNPIKIDYAKKRSAMLRIEDINGFLNYRAKEGTSDRKAGFEERNKYFTNEGRLDKIRSRLDHLLFILSDITKSTYKIKERFRFIFLSNVLESKPACSDPGAAIQRVITSLKPQGMLYISDDDKNGAIVQRYLLKDTHRTEIALAREHQFRKSNPDTLSWNPGVYIAHALLRCRVLS